MAKDPAVLFYTSDFLSGTSFFNNEQRGQYILLLCQQHQLGVIPENHMISVCGSLDSPVAKKFTKDEQGSYYNIRMREEGIKRANFCASRSNDKSGRPKVKSHDNHMINIRKSHVNHTENENDNGNEVKNTIPKNTLYDFEPLWAKYPNKDGKKDALRHFKASVLTDQDYSDISKAIDNYLLSKKVKEGFIKNGSTFFNNWRDWVDVTHATGKSQALLDIERMIEDDRKRGVSSLSKVS